ncbi:MAG: EAL domain-containing protein [Eubacteriales bacterium]
MRERSFRIHRMRGMLLGVVFILLCLSDTLQVRGEVGEEEVTTIRIGYKENYVAVKTPYVEGYEGYGYEYLTEMFGYAEGVYELEFVEVIWSEGLEMLERGELDLLAGANYTQERAEKFLYPDKPLGDDTSIIVALQDDDIVMRGEDVYEALEGSSICVQKEDAMAYLLYDFLEKHGIQATITEEDIGSIRYAIQSEEYDYLLTNSMQMESDINVVYGFESVPVYVMANASQGELVEVMNRATEGLEGVDYLLKSRLYLKYFDNAVSRKVSISSEELELFADNNYIVAIEDLNSPFSYTNQQGELNGFYVDYIELLQKITGIEMTIHSIDETTPMEEIRQSDFALMSRSNIHNVGMRTNAIAQFPFVLIENVENIEKEQGDTIVGVLRAYGLNEVDIEYFTGEASIVVYDDLFQMSEDFRQEEISVMFLTTKEFNVIYDDCKSINYLSRNIDYWFSPMITFRDDFPLEKVDIFNKMLTHVNELDIDELVSNGISGITAREEIDYLRYFLIIILVILLLGLIIVQCIYVSKNKEIRELSDIDPITGLYTKDKFMVEIEKILMEEGEAEYAILSLDIDSFKYINEIYGFETGTKILQQIAYHMKKKMTDPLPVGRFGGDGYLLLVQTDAIESRIKESFELEDFGKGFQNLLDDNYTISFSIGVYAIQDRSLDVTYMIDCANIARRESKHYAGTTFRVYTDYMKEEFNKINDVISRGKKGLAEKEFQLYYQPKIDLNTKEIIGAEALIRWFQDGKMIPPDHFIPVFENHGLIDLLDYYVIEEACRFLQEHKRKGFPHVSVNLSGHTILQENVVPTIERLIQQYGVSPKDLDIEITESAFVNEIESCLGKLNHLREMGFTISMDDFGAGVSSLNRLRTLPIDKLKIDRAFIMEGIGDEKGSAILKNIIRLAKDLAMETIAEGIENIEQLEFLEELNCDVGQGYFFSRPLPQQEFLEFLERDKVSL